MITFRLFLTEGITKLSKGQPTSEYYATRFRAEHSGEWRANHDELESALMDQTPYRWIVEDEDKIVAAISFSEDQEVVHVSHFGSIRTGQGAQLLDAVEKFAKRKKKLVVLVPSYLAKEYYLKRGYAPTSQGELLSK